MKKTILMSIVALAVSVGFISVAMALQKPAPAATAQETKLEEFHGVIEKVDEATKDVLVQFHKEKLTFSMDDKTKITEGKKELSFADLKNGMWASVEYKKEGNKLMTESISVSMPRMEAKHVSPSEKATEKK